MKNHLFLPFLLVAIVSSAQQNVKFEEGNFKNDEQGYNRAVTYLDSGEVLYKMGPKRYSEAIPYFLEAEKFNPNNDQLNYLIGICMLAEYSPDKTTALPYLQTAYKINPKVTPDIHYQLGRAYHFNMQWEDAKQEYNTYLQSLNATKDKQKIADTKKKIEECDNGETLTQNPIKNIVITNLGENINTQYPEYGAEVTPDQSEIVFTSRRPNNKEKHDVARTDGLYMENVYMALNQNGTWGTATNLGPTVNTTGQDALAGISADAQTLYIYHGENGGDIYESHLNGNTWSDPKPLGGKINTHHEQSVSLAPDNKTLYFASDRPGGYGGSDIYMSVADANGVWGDPKNLGPVVNTKYNDGEMSIQPDGITMYFSSEGHNTMGGYDIFKTTKNDSGKWTTPVNMGYPINGPDDDIFYTVASDGKHAYFSSIRKGGYGAQDIYMVSYIYPKKAPLLTMLDGTITDSLTHQPIAASIEVVNNTKDSMVAKVTSDASTGKFQISLPEGVNYGVAIKADGYLFSSLNIDLSDTSKYRKEIIENISLQPLKVNSSVVLNNIFFDFNKSVLRDESKAELDRVVEMLKDSPTIKIRISGYCDSVGTIPYNLELSIARAKSVVSYLTKHGISAKRLSYKGYGKSHYAASNSTDEGRQKNRRVEFEIIEMKGKK